MVDLMPQTELPTTRTCAPCQSAAKGPLRNMTKHLLWQPDQGQGGLLGSQSSKRTPQVAGQDNLGSFEVGWALLATTYSARSPKPLSLPTLVDLSPPETSLVDLPFTSFYPRWPEQATEGGPLQATVFMYASSSRPLLLVPRFSRLPPPLELARMDVHTGRRPGSGDEPADEEGCRRG